MNKIPIVQTAIVCPECGNVSMLWRKAGKQKEIYHKKSFFCIICKRRINHIEVKDIDMFLASLNFKEELSDEERLIKMLVKKRGE